MNIIVARATSPCLKKHFHLLVAHATLIALLLPLFANGQDQPYSRTKDVIYGRSYGTALTMDVFIPKKQNGAAVLAMVSGGWFSSPESINNPFFSGFINTLTNRGYVVFAVVHGSNPKYSIPEILPMIDHATRFVRAHAGDYHFDLNRIGITGGSAGGHLSLMQAVAPLPDNPKSTDPLDKVSSKIQACVAFFPPTDFLNYGKPNHDALGRNELGWLKPPFDFTEIDPKTKQFILITDETKRKQIGREISPIYHVAAGDPPIMIIHGDKDPLVPIQQAESMIAKLKEANDPCELVVKKEKGHGWVDAQPDWNTMADFFDKHLK